MSEFKSGGGILDLIKEEAEKKAVAAPSSDNLSDLGQLIAQLERLKGELAEAENEVSRIKKEITKLEQTDIPEVFNQAGNLASIKLEDGAEVSVEDDLAVNVNKADELKLFQFLEEVGKKEIIKREFKIVFDRGQGADAQEAREKLLEDGLEFVENETVHHSTLKSVVKKLRKEGVEFPDYVKLFEYKKTKVKR